MNHPMVDILNEGLTAQVQTMLAMEEAFGITDIETADPEIQRLICNVFQALEDNLTIQLELEATKCSTPQ